MPHHIPILTFYKATRWPFTGGYYEAGCTCLPWYGGDHRDPAKAMEEWRRHAAGQNPGVEGVQQGVGVWRP